MTYDDASLLLLYKLLISMKYSHDNTQTCPLRTMSIYFC